MIQEILNQPITIYNMAELMQAEADCFIMPSTSR